MSISMCERDGVPSVRTMDSAPAASATRSVSSRVPAASTRSSTASARGHHVRVITATYPGEPVDPPGVQVSRVEPLLRIGNAPLLLPLARLRDYDVIHVHQPFIFGADLAALSAKLRRIPLVSTLQNE